MSICNCHFRHASVDSDFTEVYSVTVPVRKLDTASMCYDCFEHVEDFIEPDERAGVKINGVPSEYVESLSR